MVNRADLAGGPVISGAEATEAARRGEPINIHTEARKVAEKIAEQRRLAQEVQNEKDKAFSPDDIAKAQRDKA